MTPGTPVCRASWTVTAPERAMSAAVMVDTVPGTLPIASSLPVTGDILTKPPPTLSGTAAMAGAWGGTDGAEVRFCLGGVLDVCFAAGGVTITGGKVHD